MSTGSGPAIGAIRSRLDCAAREIDAAMAELDGAAGAPAGPDDQAILQTARSVQATRRKRRDHLRHDLLGEPAWDMMLDLFVARLQGGEVSVSALCVAAQVPPTTALRYLAELERGGEVVRTIDPRDHRRKLVRLSDAAADAVRASLAWMVRRPAA